MRYTEIFNESPNVHLAESQFGDMQKAIYAFVLRKLKTTPAAKNRIKGELQDTDTFWVSSFDQVLSAIQNGEVADIQEAIGHAVSDVAARMKDWVEDSNNHEPGYKPVPVDTSAADDDSVMPLVKMLAPDAVARQAAVDADANKKQQEEFKKVAIEQGPAFLKYVSDHKDDVWNAYHAWIQKYKDNPVPIRNSVEQAMEQYVPQLIATRDGEELKQFFIKHSSNVVGDFMEAMGEYMDETNTGQEFKMYVWYQLAKTKSLGAKIRQAAGL